MMFGFLAPYKARRGDFTELAHRGGVALVSPFLRVGHLQRLSTMQAQ